MRRSKAVVSLSGGADSATLLYLAVAECQEVHALSVDYGQRHKKELTCAAALCEKLHVPHKVITFDLTTFGGSPLTDLTMKVPAQADKKQTATVVPFRNTVLATLCAAHAKQYQFNTIYMGPTYEDLASYEDCRPEFYNALQNCLRLGGSIHDLEIRTPFISALKSDIVLLGYHTLEVPYELTWTCYEGKDKPCLVCDACRERMESFAVAGLRDPLVTDDADWAQYESLQTMVR